MAPFKESLYAMLQLNKCYRDVCKSTSIPSLGIMELSSMCRVLDDQVILLIQYENIYKHILLNINIIVFRRKSMEDCVSLRAQNQIFRE